MSNLIDKGWLKILAKLPVITLVLVILLVLLTYFLQSHDPVTSSRFAIISIRIISPLYILTLFIPKIRHKLLLKFIFYAGLLVLYLGFLSETFYISAFRGETSSQLFNTGVVLIWLIGLTSLLSAKDRLSQISGEQILPAKSTQFTKGAIVMVSLCLVSLLFVGIGGIVFRMNSLLDEAHQDDVESLAFHPNSNILASGSDDYTLKLWEVQSGRLLHSLTDNTGTVSALAYSPDGSMLASGCWFNDYSVKIRNGSTGRVIRELKTPQSSQIQGVISLAFSPDQKTIAVGRQYGWLNYYDVATGELLADFQVNDKIGFNSIQYLKFSPSGRFLMAGTYDNTIYLWNLQTKETAAVIMGYIPFGFRAENILIAMKAVESDPEGLFVSLNITNGNITPLDKSLAKINYSGIFSIDPTANLEHSLLYTTKGLLIPKIDIWDICQGALIKERTLNLGNRITNVVLSPDGEYIAVATDEAPLIRILSARSGRHLRCFPSNWLHR